MAASDKAYFFDAVKQRTFTVEEIQQTFQVGESTARNWVKDTRLEKIPGSYPFSFRLKGSNLMPNGTKAGETLTADVHANCLRPMPYGATEAQKEQMLNSFLDGEKKWEVGEKLRGIESAEDIDNLLLTLKSIIVTAQYYQNKLR